MSHAPRHAAQCHTAGRTLLAVGSIHQSHACMRQHKPVQHRHRAMHEAPAQRQLGAASWQQRGKHSRLAQPAAKFSADSAAAEPFGSVRVRAAQLRDTEAVARLCGQVFAEDEGVLRLPVGPSRDALVAVQRANAAQIAATLLAEMQAALKVKQQATRDAREWRLYRRYTALKAEIAALRGHDAAAFLAPPTPMEWRQLERWQRQRQFAVLLAEDSATGQLLGAVTLSLTRCEAALPPPLPTSKPLRLYVSNMVVAPGARRRGVATELLHACTRLGRRWRRDSAWLHVEERNTAGLGLYQAAGFRGVSTQRRWTSAFRRCRLMTRPLPRPPPRQTDGGNAAEQQAVTVTGGSTRRADGVFISDTTSRDN